MSLLREEKGQVTVFLALIFCLLLGVSFLSLEGIHAYENTQLTEEMLLAAGESLLAGYDRVLFERYHVFFLDPRQKDRLEEDGRDYLAEGLLENPFYGASCKSFEIHEEVGAFDYDGAPVLAQIRRWGEKLTDRDKTSQVKKEKDRITAISQEGRKGLVAELPAGGSGHPDSDSGDETETEDEYLRERICAKELRDAVEMIMRSGPLYYAMNEEKGISALLIEGKDLPSAQKGIPADPEEEDPAFSFGDAGSLDSLLADREDGKELKDFIYTYIDDCFSSYADPAREKTALAYGKEYLLAGGYSDQENLRSAANQIFRIRFLAACSCARKDEGLKSRAGFLASCIAGRDGWPESEAEAGRLLLGALCYGEAALDLHDLLCGRKLPPEKSPATFRLNFENAAKLLREKPEGLGGGMGYEDFLDSLLIMEEEEVCLFRMMDLMEADTALEESGFKLRDCLYGFTTEAKLSVPAWFVTVPGFGLYFDQFRELKMRKMITYH